jgi:chromate transporter
MLDGLGLAETTPGPLIMVVEFVGFLGAFRAGGSLPPHLSGMIGAAVTTWVTFAPCFLFIFAGAPYVEYLRGRRGPRAALRGVTAAVVGVVLNLALWFAVHALFREVGQVTAGPVSLPAPRWTSLDWRATLIAVAALVAVFRYRVGVLPLLGGAAVAGLLLSA